MHEMGVYHVYHHGPKIPLFGSKWACNTILDGKSQINASKQVKLVYSGALITPFDIFGKSPYKKMKR